jgi:hypothetical protein
MHLLLQRVLADGPRLTEVGQHDEEVRGGADVHEQRPTDDAAPGLEHAARVAGIEGRLSQVTLQLALVANALLAWRVDHLGNQRVLLAIGSASEHLRHAAVPGRQQR